MHFRTLIPLIIALLALAVAAACGDDDDNSTDTPTVSASASAGSGSPTASAGDSPTLTNQPTFTPILFVTPSRSLPPADHNAIGVFDAISFYQQELGTGVPTAVECSGVDLEQGIIDCVAQGYGTIAVDPIPRGGTNWRCAAQLDPDGVFFAASCNGETVGFIWAIQD
jgi:hypothetical protein